MPDFPAIREIATFLERWAPRSTAQSYDNVGLQVGDPDARVERAVIALDMTPAVLEEAISIEASLVITHHPLLFHPLTHVTTTTFVSNLAYRLAANGIGLYSIHTNLDAASGGVSYALGRQLGLTDMNFLDVFTPDGDAPDLTASNVDEIGFGAIGRLNEPMRLHDFLGHVADCLKTPSLRYVGDPAASVEHVAVCGGAGSDLIEKAAAANADAYVTADVTYHDYFSALDRDGLPRLAFIDAGHYETEAVTESLLAGELQERFPDAAWRRTRTRTSPVRTFVVQPQ